MAFKAKTASEYSRAELRAHHPFRSDVPVRSSGVKCPRPTASSLSVRPCRFACLAISAALFIPDNWRQSCHEHEGTLEVLLDAVTVRFDPTRTMRLERIANSARSPH